MGKQGPCYQCGITSTPLWRNGPPDKPILCNACGLRWRTKGTLVNYTPVHARSIEITDSLDYTCGWGKKGSQKLKQQKSYKRNKLCDGDQDAEFVIFESVQHYPTDLEEDASNRSSSGSGISYSEGCVQYGDAIGMDCTGLVHIPVWDSHIPSKKRTCMYRRRPSSVEKLTKGLRYILHEQDSSYLSGPQEDLLFACKTPMVPAEIGLGGVLAMQEEESEASSLLIENKECNKFDVFTWADSGPVAPSLQLQEGDENSSERGKEKVKQIMEKVELEEHSNKSYMPNEILLEAFPYNKGNVLQSCHSPLILLDLKDIINFDAFMGLLTVQEQMHLMKYLSSVDVARHPESLNCMFNSVQFQESLISFQRLLSEGMFDTYGSGLSPLHKILQKLIVTDLTNSKWIEKYSQPQNWNKLRRILDSSKVLHAKEATNGKGSNLSAGEFYKSETCVVVKNSSGSQPYEILPGSENNVKSLETQQMFGTRGTTIVPKLCMADTHHERMNTRYASKEITKFKVESKSGPFFSSSNQFVSPLEKSSSVVLDFIETLANKGFEHEQDLLLDVPSNTSFQQAELLHTPVWKHKASKDSIIDGNILENPNSGEIMDHNFQSLEDNLDWCDLLHNPSCVEFGKMLPNGTILYPKKTVP